MPSRERQTVISSKDLAIVLALPFNVAFACLLPEPLIPAAARCHFEIRNRVTPQNHRRFVRHIRKVADGTSIAEQAEEVARALFIAQREKRLHLLRRCRPGGWSPASNLRGENNLRESLAKGRGAVLIHADFIFGLPAQFQILSEHGYPVNPLYGPTHGWSNSRFGRRVLNPIVTSIEGRYLAERVVLSPKALPTPRRVFSAMRRMRRLLDQGAPVMIMSMPNNWGPVKVKLFAATTKFAHGPAGLAYESKAPLLPVFTIRRDDGIIETTVEAPLVVSRDVPRRCSAETAMRQYVKRLEHYIRQHPEQWSGWRRLQPPPSD